MNRAIHLSLFLTLSSLPALAQTPPAAQQQQDKPPSPTPASPLATAMAPADNRPAAEIAAERDLLMNQILEMIKGRESEPAESVFKNILMMKGAPAGRLVRMMNMGFARSLGVSCGHCHVPGEWEKEDKPQKQIAREMMAMSRTIGGEILPKIKNLRSEQPAVNCTTCHRGQLKPALDLGGPPPAAK